MAKSYILSLDQGTTSSRALLFDDQLQLEATAQQEFTQIFPQSGWVEHDPMEILNSTIDCAKRVIEKAGIEASSIVAMGVTNQRETIVAWDRSTGKAIGNAIVWQDRRTSDICLELKRRGHGDMVTKKTGLLLDPYFSATKMKWMLDEVPGLRALADNEQLCFGTIDSWLIWQLTKGQSHKTDATNASRTMLYDIHAGAWDDELLELFGVPRHCLPDVMDCAAEFGQTSKDVLGVSIPILGVAGDQHAALIGQACFKPGAMKSTYGTGCFALLNIGDEPVASQSNLLTTLAYQIDGIATYALEGSIFIAGAGVQWLRDEVGLIDKADECDELARQSDMDDEVCLVPAFTGLGAPYWQPDVRGALMNLSRSTSKAEIVRATLEAVGFQTLDLYRAMAHDWPDLAGNSRVLRVDGGMVQSDWTMQFLADMLDCPIERPKMVETTALGAAYLAGWQAGIYPDFDGFSEQWACDTQFVAKMSRDQAQSKYGVWQAAIAKLLPNIV